MTRLNDSWQLSDKDTDSLAVGDTGTWQKPLLMTKEIHHKPGVKYIE